MTAAIAAVSFRQCRRCETGTAMALTNPEIRILASLIEKEAAVPESYPLTLSALRLACNQSTNRRPVVAYDDRTVESALMSLKSAGLARFVHPSHGGRTTRYRHTAGERWRLSVGDSLVLSALALRGAQTAADIRARVGRLLPADETATVEDMLDTLVARSPEPLAVRLGRRPGERDDRWVATLGDGEVDDHSDDLDERIDSAGHDPVLDNVDIDAVFDRSPHRDNGRDELADRVDQLAAALDEVTTRLERLESELDEKIQGVSGRSGEGAQDWLAAVVVVPDRGG